MAFPTGTIKLEAAKKIFNGVSIEPVTIGDKVAYYEATFKGEVFQNTSLTGLCSILWSAATSWSTTPANRSTDVAGAWKR